MADGSARAAPGSPPTYTPPMQLRKNNRGVLLAPVALFVIAAGIALWRIWPVHAGMVGFDSAASVLYFDRIVAGRHLESFIAATPKPLLTLVDGTIHALFGDWRPISFLSIVVYAGDVVLGTELARRLAGRAAAGFAAVGLLGSWLLLEDASAAYAVGWALLGWLVAGLLLTRPRARYGLAGVALLVAGMARFETLIIDGLVLVVLVGLALGSRFLPADRRPSAPPRAAWLLLLAFGTFPVQALHDVLLTGDPLWSEQVAALASPGAPLMTPLGAMAWIRLHYLGMAPLLLLGMTGVVALAQRRAWHILVGLVALGPGVLAFIVFLAVRKIYISARYLSPADLAVLFAAAIGVAELRARALDGALRRFRATRRLTSLHPLVPLIAGGLVAAAVVTQFGPLDVGLRQKITNNRLLFENLDAAHAALDQELARVPGVRDWPTNPSLDRAHDPPHRTLLVPVLLQPQVAVDFGLPLTSVGGLSGPDLTRPGYLAPGQILYHDPRNDLPVDSFRVIEISQPSRIANVLVSPVAVDQGRHTWLLRVEQP